LSVNIHTGVFANMSPSGTRTLVQIDGSSDKNQIGYDRWQSTDPWDFGEQGRVLFHRPGQLMNTLMPRAAYWTWQHSWGNSTDVGFGSHNDTLSPGYYIPHAWQGLVSYSAGAQRESLVIGSKDSAPGTEIAVVLAGALTVIGDPHETEAYFTVRGGVSYGYQQGWCEFTSSANVFYSCNQYSNTLVFSGQSPNIPTIASANTMDLVALGAQPTNYVSGTAAIQVISPGVGVFPPNGARLTFIPKAAWTTITGGNITRAITAVVNQPVDFIYDAISTLWYPK
jgi:hypothetical protein